MAQRRAVDIARPRIEKVAQHQANGAADRRGGAVAGSQRIEAPDHAQFLSDGPVDDDENGRAAGAGGRAVEHEGLCQHGREGCNGHRKVHRQAARHDRVDGQLLGRNGAFAYRLDAHQVVRRQHRPFQTGRDCICRGRHDGQAIGPTAAMAELLRRRHVVDCVTL